MSNYRYIPPAQKDGMPVVRRFTRFGCLSSYFALPHVYLLFYETSTIFKTAVITNRHNHFHLSE